MRIKKLEWKNGIVLINGQWKGVYWGKGRIEGKVKLNMIGVFAFYMDILNIAAAKSLNEDHSKWISFMLHSMDTGEIIERIFYERLSDSERNYIVSSLFEKETDMSEAEEKTANFCRLIALLHDIGKLTYVFQNRISANIDGLDEMFILIGINICRKCLSEEKTPHNVAGQVILKINGFPAEIYNIIGAHHGMANYVEENIRKENYYGTHTITHKKSMVRVP